MSYGRAGGGGGSTSFGACEVRCWRWLFGQKIPIFLWLVGPYAIAYRKVLRSTRIRLSTWPAEAAAKVLGAKREREGVLC